MKTRAVEGGRRRSRAVGALFLILVTGCQTVERVPRERLTSAQPLPKVWLTLPDHSTVEIVSPELHGDTLIGLVGGVREHFILTPEGVLTIRRAAPGKTAVLAVGMLGAMGLMEYEMMKDDGSSVPQ